jgi:hypothetical protein
MDERHQKLNWRDIASCVIIRRASVLFLKKEKEKENNFSYNNKTIPI